MVSTQIQLTEEQAERVKREAAARGVSMAEVIRLAIDSYIRSPTRAELWARARKAVGGGHSGFSDISVNHDKYLADDTRW